MDEGVGAVPGYRWLEHPDLDMRPVIPALVAHAGGSRVLVSCFDSGRVGCTDEERAAGWTQATAGIVSPPLAADVALPWEQHDEWWVFPSAAAAERFPAYEFFVNFGGWSLRDPKAIVASFNPTWEKDAYDWLYDYQRRFWEFVEVNRPLAYLASGDNLSVATSSDDLYVAVRATLASRG